MDAPPAKKFTVSLYFKGLRRKNREKAGRKPAKRRAKAGEKQGCFGVGIRRAGPARFDAAGQAGARRKRDADMQRDSGSAICDCRTPGLPLAGSGWVGGREGNAFSLACGSGDDVGKIIVHPFPNVKHKIRTSGAPVKWNNADGRFRWRILLAMAGRADLPATDRGDVSMHSAITVRNIDPEDKSWLGREARRVGISMEEFVRRLIHEKRAKAERRMKPSEAFARYFGPEYGVELPPSVSHGHRPVAFADEDGR